MVAEVFVGLVHGDHDFFLWMRKNWKPELPAKKPVTFTMTRSAPEDVGDVSPIDVVKHGQHAVVSDMIGGWLL